MRVAIYARCSTKKQSLDAQLAELRAHAARQEYEVTAEYLDRGISGSKTRRPRLDELMQAAARHEFEAVLVWKLDRFGRSLSHLIGAIRELDSHKVTFMSHRDNLDFSTPAGRLMFHLLAAMAEFERDLIRERVKAGIEHCKETGKTKTGRWFGRRTRVNRNDLACFITTHPGRSGVREASEHFGISQQAIRKALARLLALQPALSQAATHLQ